MVGGESMYREQILDHYRNPRNYGELDEPTVTHTGENPMCGDEIQVDLQLNSGTIEAISFTGDGCAISQAAASLLTEQLTGTDVTELEAMGRDDMVELLGVEISPMRVKCAVLAEKVAQDAYSKHVDSD